MEAFGAAANIISVIHITCEVIQRINDFRTSVGSLPSSLQQLSFELPVLTKCLERIRCDLNNRQGQDEDGRELSPMIEAFELALKRISEIIEKTRPDSESTMARNMKALTSFQYDGEVNRIREEIRGYTGTLNLEYTIKSKITHVAKPPEQPLKPRFAYPVSRDMNFVNRPIIEELLALQRPGSRYAIVGEGGIGKSQIALEYGYRIQQRNPNTWIFWVDAESDDTMEQSYREMARTLRLRGEDNVFSLVSTWLRDESNGNWVMILDNADNKTVLCSHPKQLDSSGDPKLLKEYIPQSMNGSVLVTSRSRDAAFEITCNYKMIMTIEPMNKEEGLSLLRNFLVDVHQEEDMERLLEAVDNIPLAISHAASYITKRGMPINSYLEELGNESGKELSLQEEDISQLRRDTKRGNSVVKTWTITFDHIRTTAPSAARLLSLMSHFARQRIPKASLEGNYDERLCTVAVAKRRPWWKRRLRTHRKKQQQSIPMEPVTSVRTFENDLLTLRDFNLIKGNNGGDEFSMHALVQLTTKRWLEQMKELSFWNERFMIVLNNYLSKNGVTDFSTCENLVRHALAATREQPCEASKEPLTAWASLTVKLAGYCGYNAAFEERRNLQGAAAYAYAVAIGVDAPETVQCLLAEARFSFYMGQISEAEVMFRRVHRIQERCLGKDHLDTLETMDWIVDTLDRQSRGTDANRLYEEAFKTRRDVYGIAHPKTLEFLTRRGYNLARDTKYAEAYIAWTEAAKARNSPRDMEWIEQLDALGIRLELDGQPDLAERYFRESLIEKQRIFTEDLAESDIDYVLLPKGLLKLGRNLCMQKKWCEAEPLLQQAFAWFDGPRQKAGQEHFGTRLENMYFLTFTLMQMESLVEAERLCRLFLSENDGIDNARGRRVLDWFWLSARVLERSKKFEDAIHFYEIAFKSAVETMGAEHEDTKQINCSYMELARRVCE